MRSQFAYVVEYITCLQILCKLIDYFIFQRQFDVCGVRVLFCVWISM